MTKCLQESRMREIRTSGSTRGSNGAGKAARCSLLYWSIYLINKIKLRRSG